MDEIPDIYRDIKTKFGQAILALQPTKDDTPTIWVNKDSIVSLMRYLKSEVDQPYRMLYDLTAIDERQREHRQGQPDSDFTVVYNLLSFDRNKNVRLRSRSKENTQTCHP